MLEVNRHRMIIKRNLLLSRPAPHIWGIPTASQAGSTARMEHDHRWMTGSTIFDLDLA